uniref:Venom protein n=1 Tax=Hadrurus spadix TaxID=141984 RepID=A0A1W7R944_9SCOR
MKTTFLLVIAAAFAVQISKQDSCHLREIDLCVGVAVVALSNSPVPNNQEQIDEQCKVGRETVDCFKNFTNKCTTQLQRELIGFATQSGQATFDDYCTPGSKLSKDVLAKHECLSKTWEEQRSCMTDAQAAVEAVYDAPVDKRLDVLCCAYRRYRQCGLEIARKNCGDDVEDFINQITGLVVGNLPNLICNDCGKEDSKCSGLLPPPGTKPKGRDSDSPIAQLLGIYLN